MARVRPLVDVLNAGEFGPRMAARVTFAKYPSAGEIYKNILPLPQGGWTRRPGSRYVAAAKSNSAVSRILPFIFSTVQAYVLELGNNAIRFFKDQAQIVTNDVGASVSNGAFGSGITDWDDISNGTGSIAHDSTNSDLDLVGAGSGNEAIAEQDIITTSTNVEHTVVFKVVGDPGDKIKVRVGASSGADDYLEDATKEVGWHSITFTPTASPFYLQFKNEQDKTISIDDVSIQDNTPVELPTPWGTSDLFNLNYSQSADVVYFGIGGAVRPYRLSRYGHGEWSLEKVLFEDGPYLSENSTSTTLTPGATSGNSVTITASATTGINDDVGFRAGDVGRLIRIKDAANNWTWAQIVEFTSTTVVKVDIKGADLSSTAARTTWRLGEWNDVDGWPSVVGFVQQRLALANTTKSPQAFWLSESSLLESFADSDKVGDVLDTSGFKYTLAARSVHAIQWIASRKVPVIGTVSGVWVVVSDGAAITPTDVNARHETSVGAMRTVPVEARNRLLFLQSAERKLEEFADVLTEGGVQGFDAFDLTLLHDRVLSSGAVQMAYAEQPDSNLVAVRNDGQLAVLTYQPDQEVLGWARYILGGTFEGGDAVVESVAAIPGQNGSGQFKDSTGRTEVWVTVKRKINGATARYIEVFEKLYNADEDLQQDAFYVDSGLTLDNPITITNITQANPGVVTTDGAHGFSDGDTVRIVRVKGMTEVNGVRFTVANSTSTTFELQDLDSSNIDTSSYTGYEADGEVRKRVTSISGLSHLEGETVGIMGDGAVQGDKVVSGGSITMDTAAALVHVGLKYEHRWKSLKLAFGSQGGTSVGKYKNLPYSTVVLMETGEGALELAVEDSDGENSFNPLVLRDATSFNDDPVPFFTGEVDLGLIGGYDSDIRLVLKGDHPSPCTVLAVAPEIQTNEAI